MSRKTIVIVPPKLLVQMFGVPESVAMPSRRGEETVFDCYGKRFHVKRLNRSSYVLTCPLVDPRARFGTAEQIAQDIGRVFETGTLPREKSQIA